jgi:peptide/nickel transport system permease protein
MWGARTAVFVAVVVLTISTVMGVALGSLAAYAGGWVDDMIMRVTDVTLSFPDLLLAAFLSVAVRNPVIDFVARLEARTHWAILEQTIFLDYLMLFGALAAVGWAGKARLIRGQVLSLREQEFIRAVQALGTPTWMIIRKHLIPNAIAPVIVSMTIQVGSTMLSEASLSFLGLGIQPPGASWGNMVSEGLVFWTRDPHLVYIPGIVLAVAVFGFNFLGDGLNDAMNPRQIRR